MVEERVVVLETELEHLRDDVAELKQDVRELTQAMARYRGMWGMALMIGGALLAGVQLAVSYFKHG